MQSCEYAMNTTLSSLIMYNCAMKYVICVIFSHFLQHINLMKIILLKISIVASHHENCYFNFFIFFSGYAIHRTVSKIKYKIKYNCFRSRLKKSRKMNRVELIVDLEKEVVTVDQDGVETEPPRKYSFSIVTLKNREDVEGISNRVSKSISKDEGSYKPATTASRRSRSAINYTKINAKEIEEVTGPNGTNKGKEKSTTNKDFVFNQRDNHKEQIPNGTYRRRKKTTCNCTTATKIEARSMVYLSIHNRKKRKPKTKICPLGNKNRTRTINYIKNRFQKGEGPITAELNVSKFKDREIAISRMWHYIDNTAYIFKQKGAKEDILSLVYELENLLAVINTGVDQIDRLLEANHRDGHMEENLDILLIAERTEAVLGAEWAIRKNRQVRKTWGQKLKHAFFRKMANFEVKLNNIGSFTEDIQNFVTSILRENEEGNFTKIQKLQKSLKELAHKVRHERNKALNIVETIEKNSQEPRNIDELYTEISEIMKEVSMIAKPKEHDICENNDFFLQNMLFLC